MDGDPHDQSGWRPEQVAWIANHAEDKVLCFDVTFLPHRRGRSGSSARSVKHWIALCDADKLPADSGITGLRCVRAAGSGVEPADYTWPEFDERSAASHVLHERHHGQPEGRPVQPPLDACCTPTARALPDGIGTARRATSILPVVPMFHVNAWGLPYAAAMIGAKLVFPAPRSTASRSTT
mgnify:CR=1 FL=1